MNVKDLILYQPAEELAMAFADRLGIDPERRERAAQRMLRLILTLHGMEPCMEIWKEKNLCWHQG